MEKVSIITPIYNGEKFIEETSKSVLGQTHQNWEWLIIDDCSTDNTHEILRKLAAQDDRVKVIYQKENGGAAIARNTGLEASTGDFVTFLDCDDAWRHDKLEIQLKYADSQNAEFTFHHYRIIDESGKVLKIQKVKKYVEQKELLRYNPFATSSIMIKNSVIKEKGLKFRVYLRRRQDYLFWYDAVGACNKAMGVSDILSDYRIFSKESLSANKKKMALIQWQLLRDEFHLNIISRIYNFIRYAIHGIKKYFFHRA